MWRLFILLILCEVIYSLNDELFATPGSSNSENLPVHSLSEGSSQSNGYELFAVIGGNSCAEMLYYGPQAVSTTGSADGAHEFFFSTSTANRNTPHNKWLQIVTENGQHELFRIYWTFSDSKTLAGRFINAVASGESVRYEIFTNLNFQYSYSGIWRFSSTARLNPNTFSTTTTQCCFSADNGVWGGGPRTIDGNNNYVRGSTVFWGQGNFRSRDTTSCAAVYASMSIYTPTRSTPKSYMYYYTESDPTAVPTQTPTKRPPSTSAPTHTSAPTATPAPTTTPAPTISAAPTTSAAPTYVPTARPTLTSRPTAPGMELFAIVGGSSCAEDLYYGPRGISSQGSADGYAYYLATNTTGRNLAHTEWLQIVTAGASDTELFRIYWSFHTARTLPEHFAQAVSSGVAVSYKVVYSSTGDEVALSGTWWFSGTSKVSSRKDSIFGVADSSCCFSADDGAWGGGNGVIDGNDANSVVLSGFWGVGNFDSSDDSDCSLVYVNGRRLQGVRGNVKSFMYHSTVSFDRSGGRQTVRFSIALVLTGFVLADYTGKRIAYETALKKSLADSMYGVSEHDISRLTISEYTEAASVNSGGAHAQQDPTTSTNSSAVDRGENQDLSQDTILWLEDFQRISFNVSTQDTFSEEDGYRAIHVASTTTTKTTVKLQCIVEIANSVYSYSALLQLLQQAMTNGAFDATLRNYALYLKVPALAGASPLSIETIQLASASSGNEADKGLPASTIAVIVVSIVGLCILGQTTWCKWYVAPTRRVSFEVDADIEVAAMEASVAASRAQNDAVNTWTVRPTRRTNPRGAVTLPWEVSDNTHDRRFSVTRNTNRARSVEASAGNVFGEEDDDNDDFGESRDAFRTENTGGSTRNNTTAAGPYSGRSARSSASAGATAAAATPVVVPVMEIPSAVVARRNSAPLVSARVVGEGQLSNVAVAVPATPRQVLNGLVVAEAYVQNS